MPYRTIFQIKAFKAFLKPILSTVIVLSFSPSLNSLLNMPCRRLLQYCSVFTNHISASVTQSCSVSNLGCLFPFSIWSFCHFLVSASRAIHGRKIRHLQAYFVLQDAEKSRMYRQSLRNTVWGSLVFLTMCDIYQEEFEWLELEEQQCMP